MDIIYSPTEWLSTYFLLFTIISLVQFQQHGSSRYKSPNKQDIGFYIFHCLDFISELTSCCSVPNSIGRIDEGENTQNIRRGSWKVQHCGFENLIKGQKCILFVKHYKKDLWRTLPKRSMCKEGLCKANTLAFLGNKLHTWMTLCYF